MLPFLFISEVFEGDTSFGAQKNVIIRFQSCAIAEDIMYEVFKAMKSLGFEWKIFNPYHIIVRKKPECSTHEPVSVFFSTSLFYLYFIQQTFHLEECFKWHQL